MPYNYTDQFARHVNLIKNEGRYRNFVKVQRMMGNFPYATHSKSGKKITMWCSNDYLGMSQHPKVITAAKNAITEYGIGSGGTRNIGGNNSEIVELEHELADLHGKESALVFSSGYVANDTALTALAQILPNLVFISDEANHASIIAGIRNSRAEKLIYQHLNMADLEKSLQSVELDRPKVIVFESVYSMDGLASDLEQICYLAKKYNALTFIDEVHTVGLYGDQGRGYANFKGYSDKIDIIQGTLGKAYGAIGGYIAGDSLIVDAIRLTGSGFIFTTSLPPAIAAAAKTSIRHLRLSDHERTLHQIVVAKVKQTLTKKNIRYLANHSHIIPIMINDPAKAKAASEILLEKYAIYVQHINFPTVARGTERLRIIPTPAHTDQMIKELIEALADILILLEIERDIEVTPADSKLGNIYIAKR